MQKENEQAWATIASDEKKPEEKKPEEKKPEAKKAPEVKPQKIAETEKQSSYEQITHRKKSSDTQVFSDTDVETMQEKEMREKEIQMAKTKIDKVEE